MTYEARLIQTLTALFIAAIGLGIILFGLGFPPAARLIPSIIGVALTLLSIVDAVGIWRTPIGTEERPDAEGELGGIALLTNRQPWTRFGTIAIATLLVVPVIMLVGYPIATSLYILICLLVLARMSIFHAALITIGNFVIIYAFLRFAVGVQPLDGYLFSL